MMHHPKKTAVALLLVIGSTVHGETSDVTQPNVLLIVSDDQRPDTIEALGNRVIRTPNLDALARRSSVFTRAVCANPICTPSRAEILSGCTGFRTGVLDFRSQQTAGFVSLAETMQRGGYQTTAGLFSGGGGKWMKPSVEKRGRGSLISAAA